MLEKNSNKDVNNTKGHINTVLSSWLLHGIQVLTPDGVLLFSGQPGPSGFGCAALDITLVLRYTESLAYGAFYRSKSTQKFIH